jgi:hypothetical protein
MENAKLLMQAQTDLGLLVGHMAAGEERTKRQIEWYQAQQQQEQQRVQGHHHTHQRQQQQQQQQQQQGCQQRQRSRQKHAYYPESQISSYGPGRNEQDDNRSECVIM